MQALSRVGDDAHCPSDSHGNICCSHSVTGPGQVGSPTIMTNGQQPLRVGDPGIHSGCCGPNTWVVQKGSKTVSFNDIPVARVGDVTTHCGGVGTLIVGSKNIYIGG